MNIELKDGTAVSSLHGDGSGELIAVFQYDTDAEAFCREKIKDEAGQTYPHALIMTSLHNAKSKVIMPKGGL